MAGKKMAIPKTPNCIWGKGNGCCRLWLLVNWVHNSAAEVYSCMSSFRSCTRVLNNLPLKTLNERFTFLLKFFWHGQDLPRGTCAQFFQIHYNRQVLPHRSPSYPLYYVAFAFLISAVRLLMNKWMEKQLRNFFSRNRMNRMLLPEDLKLRSSERAKNGWKTGILL